jgi:hypothetical protein
MLAAGCIDKSSEQKLSGDGGGEKVGEVDISGSEQPLAALSLCQSLMPEVPKHLLDNGAPIEPGAITVATLAPDTTRKKSREACNVRARIRQGLVDQQQAAWIACFLETQKGMKAGGKYRLTYTATAPSMPPMNLTQDQPPGPGDGPSMGGDPTSGGPGGDPTSGGPGGDPMGGGPGGDPTGGGSDYDSRP